MVGDDLGWEGGRVLQLTKKKEEKMSGIKFPGGSRAAKPLEQSTHKLKLNLALSLSLSQPYLAHQKWVELWRPELANTIL